MKPLIFWQQPLRVTGNGSIANAVTRLNRQLAIGRFSTQDRLMGLFRGDRLRVWKASVLGRAGDIVEFEGTLRATDSETVIEGTVKYQMATKVQFAGLLAIGVLLLGTGLAQKIGSPAAGDEVVGLGLVITTIAVIWIGSSAGMRGTQIEYLEEKFREILAP